MAIKTSVFGGWTLSGEEAEAFERQTKTRVKNKLAQAAYEKGKKILKQMDEKGYAVIKLEKKKK